MTRLVCIFHSAEVENGKRKVKSGGGQTTLEATAMLSDEKCHWLGLAGEIEGNELSWN